MTYISSIFLLMVFLLLSLSTVVVIVKSVGTSKSKVASSLLLLQEEDYFTSRSLLQPQLPETLARRGRRPLHWPKGEDLFKERDKHTVIMGRAMCSLGRFLVNLFLFYGITRFFGFILIEKRLEKSKMVRVVTVTVPTYSFGGKDDHGERSTSSLMLVLLIILAGAILAMMLFYSRFVVKKGASEGQRSKVKKKKTGRRRLKKPGSKNHKSKSRFSGETHTLCK